MTKPLISIIVIIYKMRRQAERTLLTMFPDFQKDIKQSEYEVIVVENESTEMLDPNFIKNLPVNIKYFSRKETSVTPVAAINFAFEQCAGSFIGLILDGARMLSPKVLSYAKMAYLIHPESLVSVPGYHLGEKEQHLNTIEDIQKEVEWLNCSNWQKNGYELFNFAVFGGGNRFGFFHPFMESNCFFSSFNKFKLTGFADPSFDLPGGGALNLHMFRSIGLMPDTPYFLLYGEGTFHQSHGGVTTNNIQDREKLLAQTKAQLESKWHGGFHALRREPILLGTPHPYMMERLKVSSVAGLERFNRFIATGDNYWPDDVQQH